MPAPHSREPAARHSEIIKQILGDLREMRVAAGLHAHPAGSHVDPEGHHANDSLAQRQRERGEASGHEEGNHEGAGGDGGHEGRGEHGGKGRGEEGKTRMAKNKKHVHTYRIGANLTLDYNPNTEAFVGHVKNTTKRTLSQVRVEITSPTAANSARRSVSTWRLARRSPSNSRRWIRSSPTG